MLSSCLGRRADRRQRLQEGFEVGRDNQSAPSALARDKHAIANQVVHLVAAEAGLRHNFRDAEGSTPGNLRLDC
jgi:hypothetical protein